MGYISCHQLNAKVGSIGLVGVKSNARGMGIGQQLIDRSLEWFSGNGAHSVEVVTQGRNIRAQRFYQRSGFISNSVMCWYHKWF